MRQGRLQAERQPLPAHAEEVGVALREDRSREPRTGADPTVAASAPALIHIEAAVVDRLVPAPPEKAVSYGPALPGIPVRHRIVTQPPGADDRRCLAVDDLIRGPVAEPVLVDPEAVPVGLEARPCPSAQVMPGITHIPRPRRSGTEQAKRADVVVDLADHVPDTVVHVERSDDVGAVAAVLAIQAPAGGPV